jgi:hypothetical protein
MSNPIEAPSCACSVRVADGRVSIRPCDAHWAVANGEGTARLAWLGLTLEAALNPVGADQRLAAEQQA